MSALSFMGAHRSFGEVVTQPYRNRITVAASAYDGKGRVCVHGRTEAGQDIGGLLTIDDARLLLTQIAEAVEYAESVAAEQKVASIPELERQLAQARSAREAGA